MGERWVSDEVKAAKVLVLTSLLHSQENFSHSLKGSHSAVCSPAKETVCSQQAETSTLEMKVLVVINMN